MICGHCTPPLADEISASVALGISLQSMKKLLDSGEIEYVQRGFNPLTSGKFRFVTRDELIRYSIVRHARQRKAFEELRELSEILDMEP